MKSCFYIKIESEKSMKNLIKETVIYKKVTLNPDYSMDRTIHVSRNEVLEILDKLIER